MTPKRGKSTDCDPNLIILVGGQDSYACQISGHSCHVFSRQCLETSQDGQTNRWVVGKPVVHLRNGQLVSLSLGQMNRQMDRQKEVASWHMLGNIKTQMYLRYQKYQNHNWVIMFYTFCDTQFSMVHNKDVISSQTCLRWKLQVIGVLW